MANKIRIRLYRPGDLLFKHGTHLFFAFGVIWLEQICVADIAGQ